ncbi:hypothetical protein C8J56DRAFT_401550 [Mycena floridula]|nr:hypothetical protein C8J56DRAFT_401550 [Mycena floridula]
MLTPASQDVGMANGTGPSQMVLRPVEHEHSLDSPSPATASRPIRPPLPKPRPLGWQPATRITSPPSALMETQSSIKSASASVAVPNCLSTQGPSRAPTLQQNPIPGTSRPVVASTVVASTSTYIPAPSIFQRPTVMVPVIKTELGVAPSLTHEAIMAHFKVALAAPVKTEPNSASSLGPAVNTPPVQRSVPARPRPKVQGGKVVVSFSDNGTKRTLPVKEMAKVSDRFKLEGWEDDTRNHEMTLLDISPEAFDTFVAFCKERKLITVAENFVQDASLSDTFIRVTQVANKLDAPTVIQHVQQCIDEIPRINLENDSFLVLVLFWLGREYHIPGVTSKLVDVLLSLPDITLNQELPEGRMIFDNLVLTPEIRLKLATFRCWMKDRWVADTSKALPRTDAGILSQCTRFGCNDRTNGFRALSVMRQIVLEYHSCRALEGYKELLKSAIWSRGSVKACQGCKNRREAHFSQLETAFIRDYEVKKQSSGLLGRN